MRPNRSTESPIEDAELVSRTCRGDRSAFGLLVERYQRRATSVAYRLLGNLHDALEVVQDSFVRALRGLDSLEEPARFGSWLLRIVTNLSLNFRRDRAVGRPKVSLDDCIHDHDSPAADLLADGEHSEGRPGARAGAEELSAAVHAAIGELPEAQRTALVLFSIEEMPQKEVAEIMNCSVEAVKWHVFQARRKLRERLADFL